MITVFCRLESLKIEGFRFFQEEIVNKLIQKTVCVKRVVVEIEGVKKWRRMVKREWRTFC